MFDLIDRSRNEKVSLEDFKKIIFEINTKVDDQEINEIFIEMSKKKLFFSFEDWDDYIQKQFFLK